MSDVVKNKKSINQTDDFASVNEWQISKFGDYVDAINGYAFKSSNFLAEKLEGAMPVIKIKNVANGKSNLDGIQYHQYDKTLAKYVVKNGDVLIALTGNHPQAETQVVGLVTKYHHQIEGLLNQRVAKIVAKDENSLCNDFIYYFLKDKNTHQYLSSQSTGSANQANISKSDIENISFAKPTNKEQKAIATILSSLDDKIDLLHRQNKTLEAMAETLFRQWFVEEAGADWEEKPLSFFGNIVCGKTPSKECHEYFGGDFPLIKIPDMHGKTFVFKTEDSLTEKGKNSQINKSLPPFSICVSCIATVGLVCLTTKESQTNQQINAIIPKNDNHTYFLFLTMKASFELLHALASGGTATLNLNTSNFSKIGIPFPGVTLLENFNNEVSPLFKKVYSNQNQIQILEKIRDNLLPKLMSGELLIS